MIQGLGCLNPRVYIPVRGKSALSTIAVCARVNHQLSLHTISGFLPLKFFFQICLPLKSPQVDSPLLWSLAEQITNAYLIRIFDSDIPARAVTRSIYIEGCFCRQIRLGQYKVGTLSLAEDGQKLSTVDAGRTFYLPYTIEYYHKYFLR